MARWPFPDAAVRAQLSDPDTSWAEFHDLDLPVPSLTVDTSNGYAPLMIDICLDPEDEAGDVAS